MLVSRQDPISLTSSTDNDLTQGLSIATSDIEQKTIQLELNVKNGDLASCIGSLQRHIETETGFVTVIKGLGTLGSSVAELGPPVLSDFKPSPKLPIGVVRISQLGDNQCYVDGQVERLGLDPVSGGLYSLAVHEYGDLGGKDFESIGNPILTLDRKSSTSDHVLVKKVIPNCNVASIIGRSVALTEHLHDAKHQVVSAGVIARASTVGSNKKQVCSCSGKTLWEERLDRRQNESSN